MLLTAGILLPGKGGTSAESLSEEIEQRLLALAADELMSGQFKGRSLTLVQKYLLESNKRAGPVETDPFEAFQITRERLKPLFDDAEHMVKLQLGLIKEEPREKPLSDYLRESKGEEVGTT